MSEVKVRQVPIHCQEILDIGDFNMDCRVQGFCESTMTLLFKSHPLFNASLLPPGVHPESASTNMALTHSLAFKSHSPFVTYVTSETLSKLYHVIDNPVVEYDDVTQTYYESRMYYIDRETMTGIVIGSTRSTNYHPVYGIFAPRGYSKIDCYNEFSQRYLISAKDIEEDTSDE